MGHGITSTDRLVVAGKPAWHGLGTLVADAPSVDEAYRLAGLGWTVDAQELRLPDGRTVEHVANVRSDTGAVLGVVSAGYERFQNAELFALMREAGVQEIESAGSLKGGRIVWGLARTGGYGVGVLNADEVASYCFFGARHDASGSLFISPLDIRVVCANTEAAARTTEGALRVQHTAGMRARLSALDTAIRAAVEGSKRRMQEAQAMARTAIPEATARGFFRSVWDATYGPMPDEETRASREKRERMEARRETLVGTWIAQLEAPRNLIAGIGGTVWAAHNVVTDWADHARTVRRTVDGETRDEARVFSALLGSSARVKTRSRELALALC